LAMAETLTIDQRKSVTPVPRIRIQLPNRLDSVCVETDEQGNLLTYEEYHPYGTTSFRAVIPSSPVSPKRYRYTGMERDEETSLAYHTARFYCPWLARWTSPDPLDLVDGPNPYQYAQSRPLSFYDRLGLDAEAYDDRALSVSLSWAARLWETVRRWISGEVRWDAKTSSADNMSQEEAPMSVLLPPTSVVAMDENADA